jgi:hypothetical protein
MDIDVWMAHWWNYLTSDFITHSELAIQKYDTVRYSISIVKKQRPHKWYNFPVNLTVYVGLFYVEKYDKFHQMTLIRK